MNCPFCSSDTKVVDKRDSEVAVRRRREPYSREKLLAGITKACEKRPVSVEAVEDIVGEIENAIREEDEIASSKIGGLVMRYLKRIDQIAYIRFASVYREFDDIRTFEKEIKMLRR